MRGPEGEYIHKLDSEPRVENKLAGQGLPAEDLTVDFFRSIGFDARFATASEDSGVVDIGPKQTIDAVIYDDSRPAMALQITTGSSKEVKEKKLREMRLRPFVRLDEMKPTDPAIPKALVYLRPEDVKEFGSDPDFDNHPQIADQILNSCILSLQFDSSQTKNPMEREFIAKLIKRFDTERNKRIH